MDKQSWRQAWGLFMTDPIPFGSVLLVAVSFVGGGLWYLRGFFAKSHVATLEAPIRTLEERLRLAEDEQGRVAKEIERLESQNANQANVINGLKNNLSPRQLQALAACGSTEPSSTGRRRRLPRNEQTRSQFRFWPPPQAIPKSASL